MANPVFVDGVAPHKADARVGLVYRVPDAQFLRDNDLQGPWIVYVSALKAHFERVTGDTTSADDGASVIVNTATGARWKIVQGVSGGVHIDAVGNTAGRDAYDNEEQGFAYYDNEADLLYIKQSAASADWSSGVPIRGNDGAPGPAGDGFNPAGAWDVGTTYDKNDMVSFGSRSFVSFVDSNIGNEPPSSDTDDAYWQFVPAAQGAKGDKGDSAYVYIAYASDDAGSDFTTTFDADLDYIAILDTTTEISSPTVGDFAGLWKNYKGRQGDPGSNGSNGAAATIAVGTVTTVGPSDPATVTNVGTSSAAVFDFDIPKGLDGANGTNGVDGEDGALWFTGTSDPSSGTGEDGDFYLQTAAGSTGVIGDVWEKAAGSWSVVGNIRGASGSGAGDMLASVYDPNNIADDAFDRANHTGTQTLSTISDAGDAAGKNVGTTAGTVAAGDDSRIVGALQKGSYGTEPADMDALSSGLQHIKTEDATSNAPATFLAGAQFARNSTRSAQVLFGALGTAVGYIRSLGSGGWSSWQRFLLDNDIGSTVASKAQGDLADSALQPTDIGTSVQAYDADTAKLDVENQALTGGATVTSKSLGTSSSGTRTLDMGDRPLQHYTNGGAHTLAPGSVNGSCLVDITNNSSAGAITTSGWTKVAGDSFTTTNGHKFRCHCSVGNGGSLLIVQALQ